MNGSPPSLQVDDSGIVPRGLSPDGGPAGVNNLDNLALLSLMGLEIF